MSKQGHEGVRKCLSDSERGAELGAPPAPVRAQQAPASQDHMAATPGSMAAPVWNLHTGAGKQLSSAAQEPACSGYALAVDEEKAAAIAAAAAAEAKLKKHEEEQAAAAAAAAAADAAEAAQKKKVQEAHWQAGNLLRSAEADLQQAYDILSRDRRLAGVVHHSKTAWTYCQAA
jgi:hypothetical protein